jgi:hypothetical protein
MLLVWIITNAQVLILGVQRTDRANPTPMGIMVKWIKETIPIVNVLVYGRGKRDVMTDILMFIIWINRTEQVLVLYAGRIIRNPEPILILLDWNIRTAHLIRNVINV